MNAPSTRRTLSNSGASRLNTSSLVSKPLGGLSNGTSGGRHPLRSSWTISYVHRPPTAKIVEYEKEIKRVASFGSIESFFSIYAHLTPASELPPVTDILLFVSRIARPIWEELPRGGKFTLRLLKPVSPLLFESLVLALIGDQFDDADGVVGCVLSVRANNEDALSIWTEDEGDIPAIREKILNLLSLPATTTCEYKSNRTLLEGATKLQAQAQGHAHTPHHHERTNGGERAHGHHYSGERNGYPKREGGYNRSHRGERAERAEGGDRDRERL